MKTLTYIIILITCLSSTACDIADAAEYTVTVSATDSVGTADVRAECHPRDVAVSGGCSAIGVNVYADVPDATAPAAPHGWACLGTIAAQGNKVTASAVCRAPE